MNKDKNRYLSKYKTLGENIRNLRKLKGISQEELAFALNSARNYLGCVERGEKRPSLAFIFDIQAALGCSLQDLFLNIK